MACASCHNDGGGDGRVWDLSSQGEGIRNTISLRGHGGMAHGRLHWTGNFDEVHDFENQIRGLAGGSGLLSDPDFAATEPTLGPPKAGLSADLDSLAAYVGSLVSFGASPYREASGALTASAEAGKALFLGSNCSGCHTGNEFTDSPQNVLHDVGTQKAASGQRLGQPLTGLDTPTLKGLWLTAPYLHDGSAATVGEAVLAHSATALGGATFTTQELADLSDYLMQIDDAEAQNVTAVYRINAGGPDYTDSLGRAWQADTGFNTGNIAISNGPIVGTPDTELYRRGRWDRSTGPEMSYALPLDDGTYTVNLHFAETWSGGQAVGNRVFNVAIEGTIVEANLDIFAIVGGYTPLVRTHTIEVSGGVLNIDFTHGAADDPIIKAIEVLSAGFTLPDTEAPTTPTGLTASPASATTVDLAWNASTDSGGSGLAGYRIFRDGIEVATSTVASHTDTGLTPSTTYTYSVSAYDNAGYSSVQSATAQATTDGNTAIVPNLTGLTRVGAETAIINAALAIGTIGTDYSSTVPVDVIISQNPSAGTSLPLGSQVDFVVSLGTIPDNSAPAVPTGLTATPSGVSAAVLNWTATTDSGGSGLAGYRVFRDGSFVGSAASNTFTDTGLAAGTSYDYAVSAIDNAGNESGQSANASLTTGTAGSAVYRINAGGPDYTDTLGQLWVADTGFNTGNIARSNGPIIGTSDAELYRLGRWDRETGPELNYTLPLDNGSYTVNLHFAETWSGGQAVGNRVFDVAVEGNTVETDFDIYALVGGYTPLVRTYEATVVDGALSIDFTHGPADDPVLQGIEVLTSELTVPDTVAPAVPTDLAAGTPTATTVPLSWSPTTDLGGSGLAGYRIYRNGSEVTTTALTSFSDGGLTANTSYTYAVSAFDNAGNQSGLSASIAVTTDADTAIVPAITGLSQTAAEAAILAAGLSVGSIGSEHSSTVPLDTIVSQSPDAGSSITVGSAIDFVVSLGPIPDNTAPSQPTGLAATPSGVSAAVLSWVESTDSGGSGLAGYRVFRDGSVAGTASSNTFTDTGLAAGTSYSYTVSAIDNAGNESGQSTSASVTTGTAGTAVYRINAGGPDYTDTLGQLWVADTGFNTGNLARSNGPIVGTPDTELYRLGRWDRETGPELNYTLPLDNGSYTVILHFAETWSGAQGPGLRVFDVAVEGTTVETDFDIFSLVGGYTPLVRTYEVTVADGQLSIDFAHGPADDPIIKAIEVLAGNN